MNATHGSLAAPAFAPARVAVPPAPAPPPHLALAPAAEPAPAGAGPQVLLAAPAGAGPQVLLEIADDLETLVRERAELQELRFGLRKAIALTRGEGVERRVFCFAFPGDDLPRWIGMGDAHAILEATEREIAALDERETDLVFEMIASVREMSEAAAGSDVARDAVSPGAWGPADA